MDQEAPAIEHGPQRPCGTESEWAEFIQQQIQLVFRSALPDMVQHLADRATTGLPPTSHTFRAADQDLQRSRRDDDIGIKEREAKVAEPEKFAGKRGGEVYRWFAQLRLVFIGKPHTYRHDAEKIVYALSYMSGSAQSWAMPLLQALDEGRPHELLTSYDAFRAAVITVFGDIDRRGNAEDRLGRIKQTGSVAGYISNFNEQAAQVEWNESSLVARFRAGLKDEILDSIATAETQPRGLQEWMAMASRIDERLWVRHQTRRPSSFPLPTQPLNTRPPPSGAKDSVGRFQSTPHSSGLVPMELDAA